MVKLSYIITTYNKLPFLKLVLSDLIKNKQDDEEVIVTDGGSSDGTPEFLAGLLKEKKITKYISEKDRGEAHGFNKAIMLASGELIKVITDDDAFYYPAIKKCRDYMLQHPTIDVLGGNTGGVDMGDRASIYWAENYQDDFLLWKQKKLTRFFFNGTCLMIRRSSLALLGLFNTNVLLTDLEYTLRITGIAQIAWCKGLISVRILNASSNNVKFAERSKAEHQALSEFYDYKDHHSRIKEVQKKQNVLRKSKRAISELRQQLMEKSSSKASVSVQPFETFDDAYVFCMNWLSSHALNNDIQFI